MKILSIALMLFTSITIAAGQNKVTTTIQVWGNCNMCKATIERSARMRGVAYAAWDNDNNLLTVTFRPKKVTLRQIQERIAAAGYDTQDVPANESDYQTLPLCCQYNRQSGQSGSHSKH